MTVSRRTEVPEDQAFLRRLITQIITEQLAAWSWPELMRNLLLDTQCNSRLESIRANYPQAESQVILFEGQRAGWLVVAERPEDLRLVEIIVLAQHRRKGIGSWAISELLTIADHAGKPLRLAVGASNSGAIRLYERIGFTRTGGDEVRHEMEFAAPLRSKPGAA